MLKPKEAATLLGLLLEDRPFDVNSAAFSRAFSAPHNTFRGCLSLSILLEERCLLKPTQRLVALYIVFDAFRIEPPSNRPFIETLLKVACEETSSPSSSAPSISVSPSPSPAAPSSSSAPLSSSPSSSSAASASAPEVVFVRQLLSNAAGELPRSTARDWLANFKPQPELPLPSASELRQTFLPSLQPAAAAGLPLDSFRLAAVSAVLPCPDVPRALLNAPEPPPTSSSPASSAQNNSSSSAGGSSRDLSSSASAAAAAVLTCQSGIGFEPPWVRPLPPLLPLQMEEIMWLPPDPPLALIWDSSMCGERGSSGGDVKRLMAAAVKATLGPAEQQQLLDELDSDSKAVFQSGLTPSALPNLVDNNPTIAAEVLQKLMGSPQVVEYLSVLAGIETSLHSLEVVNRLTTSANSQQLPPDFVRQYIFNCMTTCQSTKDKNTQNRIVRLLCVFLQSLIRNNVFQVQEIFIELQAFCIEFSRIKEAATLFKLLKTLDSNSSF